MTLDQACDFVLKRMTDDGVLKNNSSPRVVESLYHKISDEERKVVEGLPSIEIDVEQVEYLQTIAQGWAYPLNNFMNEMQVLEVIQMKTITDEVGKKHLFSVPIT